jgi:hypothetical protein
MDVVNKPELGAVVVWHCYQFAKFMTFDKKQRSTFPYTHLVLKSPGVHEGIADMQDLADRLVDTFAGNESLKWLDIIGCDWTQSDLVIFQQALTKSAIALLNNIYKHGGQEVRCYSTTNPYTEKVTSVLIRITFYL